MRRTAFLIAACLFVGCATTPRFTYIQPAWVNRGTGADVDEGQRYFSGVGYISNVKSEELRRLSASANARAEIAKLMTRYLRSLFGHVSDELAHTAPPPNDETVCITEDKVPAFIQQRFENVAIADEWSTGDEQVATARARISFDVFRAALLKMEMSPKERVLVEAKADAEFDEFVQTYRR